MSAKKMCSNCMSINPVEAVECHYCETVRRALGDRWVWYPIKNNSHFETVYHDSRLLEELKLENERLKKQNAKYREALEFYANKENWYDSRELKGSFKNSIWKDIENIEVDQMFVTFGGRRAREALKDE